jgi:hypothetical protein
MEEETRKLQQAAQFKAQPATVIHKKPFEPKKSDCPLTDITAVELNTERRAKEREEFNAKIRLEQAELEELRRMVCVNILCAAFKLLLRSVMLISVIIFSSHTLN